MLVGTLLAQRTNLFISLPSLTLSPYLLRFANVFSTALKKNSTEEIKKHLKANLRSFKLSLSNNKVENFLLRCNYLFAVLLCFTLSSCLRLLFLISFSSFLFLHRWTFRFVVHCITLRPFHDTFSVGATSLRLL